VYFDTSCIISPTADVQYYEQFLPFCTVVTLAQQQLSTKNKKKKCKSIKILMKSNTGIYRYIIMIYTAPYVGNLLMREDLLQGQVGGGWALEIETFLALSNDIEPLGECHLGPKKAPPSPPLPGQ
jgi:hypothetical protein